jgi:hypothetical protein
MDFWRKGMTWLWMYSSDRLEDNADEAISSAVLPSMLSIERERGKEGKREKRRQKGVPLYCVRVQDLLFLSSLPDTTAKKYLW